jgi:hydroxypyruvate reductase
MIEAARRERALALVRAALDAVDPAAAVRACLSLDRLAGGRFRIAVGQRRYELGAGIERVWIVGGGKASPAMAAACVEVLRPIGERLAGGLVVAKAGQLHGAQPARVELAEGGHPLPDERGCAAAARIAELVDGLGERDLLLCLLSGGASSLLALPAPGLALADLAATSRALLASGAPIGELNAVRRHLSALAGGQLAARAAPAQVATLILSDVVGSPLEAIGSGPTAADPSTFADALATLEHYAPGAGVPETVVAALRAGAAGARPETLKPGDARLLLVHNELVADGALAAVACELRARCLGMNAQVLTTRLEGEARAVGGFLAGLLRGMARDGRPLPRPACLIAAGETTVTLGADPGHGGRNQELALAAALALAGEADVLLVALATDGEDGPTDAAGALVDGTTVARARALGLEAGAHLERHDAYPLLAALGDLLMLGPTGTNVGDLVFMLAT